MIQTVIQPHEAGATMRERIAVILRLKTLKFDPNWVTEFPLPELAACCERVAPLPLEIGPIPEKLQRELIQNPGFGPWLVQLLSLIPETEDKAQISLDRDGLLRELSNLLEACWGHGQTVSAYRPTDVLAVLKDTQLNYSVKLAYLAGYAPLALTDGCGALVREHLIICGTVPVPLSNEQRALLEEPFVGTRYLFAADDFEQISELFQFCPELADIALLLHQEAVPEDLRLEDYMYFAEDAPEYLRLLTSVVRRIGSQAAGAFTRLWQRGHCALSELRRVERRARAANNVDWDGALATYSGYANLLYGDRFKTIPLTILTERQEKLLTYAIVHNKKHFIRLVDKNGEQFLRLPNNSVLLCEKLYRAHFNLNELTEKDLADCAWMMAGKLPDLLFEGGRQYTFAELKLLYDAPEPYAVLYGMLGQDDLDRRVKVFRQLRKRNALKGVEDENELSILAERLNRKPLHDWRREDFGHIEGLTARDTVKLLIHLDKLRRLLPTMRCGTDAALALRTLEHLERFDSMDALKASLLDIDQDWRSLSEAMGLSPEFMAQHQEGIVRFLCQDGAGIAGEYSRRLGDSLCTAFHRVVKAELMGQFSALKYYEGDLERELDYPVTPQLNTAWQENLSAVKGGMETRERDDFFSTILLGTQPYRTCLAYSGGSYCHCLLACFDSNKKVLYAETGGKITGRASIRLTKCHRAGGGAKYSTSRFNFVDLEDVAGSRAQRREDETVVLFLERPYISGVDPEETRQIEALFIDLARKKAGEMGVMLALSTRYHGSAGKDFVQTRLELYISASKAGDQYLDSLGGEATVSAEGSYHDGSFLVWQAG